MLTTLMCGSNGDLRHAINILQSIVATVSDQLTETDVQEALGIVPKGEVLAIIDVCWKSTTRPAAKDVVQLASCLIEAGHGIVHLIKQLYMTLMDCVVDYSDQEERFSKALDLIGRAEERCLDGADEYLILLDLLFSL
ncbi:hypothetical protein ACOME3_009448 [Neoechinorhynchus agilis]